VTVSSTLSVSGDLILSSDSTLVFSGNSTLLVQGCIRFSNARLIYRAEGDYVAGQDYEVEVGRQSADCGESSSDIEIVPSSDCLRPTSGRLESRLLLIVKLSFEDTCAVSAAPFNGSSLFIIIFLAIYLLRPSAFS